MVCSMTGYARQEATKPWGTLTWEVRSVNHRYLEPHFRLPESLRYLETQLRNLIRKHLRRGKVDVALHLQIEANTNRDLGVNMDLVKQLGFATRQINAVIDTAAPVSAMDILGWPGVISASSIDNDELQLAALELFEQALQQLAEHRAREGKELQQLIQQRLTAITVEVHKVRAVLPKIMEVQTKKLMSRLETVKSELNPERLEQELVFYAQKSDVDEELDRLDTHVSEVGRTLSQKGAIGRRLDFLMQELNREANTLSSKSIAADTTQSAVELKMLIEQMREQIQNIE